METGRGKESWVKRSCKGGEGGSTQKTNEGGWERGLDVDCDGNGEECMTGVIVAKKKGQFLTYFRLNFSFSFV